jgi:hypothetical protein
MNASHAASACPGMTYQNNPTHTASGRLLVDTDTCMLRCQHHFLPWARPGCLALFQRVSVIKLADIRRPAGCMYVCVYLMYPHTMYSLRLPHSFGSDCLDVDESALAGFLGVPPGASGKGVGITVNGLGGWWMASPWLESVNR